ncbi:MAG: glycosyltransferase family 4 protein [Candidatus Caldatribacterium sp.]|nr:glycosyltransferase family 4 protein [Candidatus Caldatribacterium sp.]
MNRLRIVLLAHYAPSLVNFRGPLIQALVERGHEVFALAPDFDVKIEEKVRALGAVPLPYSLSRTGLNPLRDGLDFLRLCRMLRRLKPDLVFAYTIKPVIYGTLASWLVGVPWRFAMIEGLGYTFTASGEKETWKKRILKRLVRFLYALALPRATKVFFLNRDDLAEFASLRIIDPGRAFLLGPIGVDLEHFAFVPPVKDPVTFIFIARLLREKGILEFVEAARKIKVKYPETRFVVLGGLDTNPGAIPQAQVESWVKEGIIEWPGHVEDVRPWIAQASVFVLPSYYREGVPRTIQEAMAMGRTVITTDVPGCRDTIIDGCNGFLVPPRDVEALARAMEHFILEPELIERMGRESRRIAEERFDVHKINAVILREMGL